MKKKFLAMSLVLMMTAVMTGCSWSDVKEKFVGESADSASSSSIEEYDPLECVKLAEYKGVEVDCTVSDEEIKAEIDAFVSQNETTVKKGTAKKGDKVIIDYTGKINGKKFDGGEAEDSTLELGSGQFIKGFEDGVVGMKVGDKKNLHLKFPKKYHDDKVAGKKVVFAVKLKGITVTPKFDDALLKKAKSEYKTVAEFKDAKKKAIAGTKKESAANTALSTVCEKSEIIKIPATLKDACKKQAEIQLTTQLQQYGMDIATYKQQTGMSDDDFNKQLDKQAESSAKQNLVLEAIAAKEELDLSEDKVIEYATDAASQAGLTLDKLKEQYKQFYGDSMPFDTAMKDAYIYEKVSVIVKDNAKFKEN